MKKVAGIALALAAVTGLGMTLTGCTEQQDYVRVCEQQTTHQRVTDAQCAPATHPGLIWVYLTATRSVPAVGGKVTGAVRSVDESSTVVKAPVSGGIVHPEEAPEVHAPVVEEPHVVVEPHIAVVAR